MCYFKQHMINERKYGAILLKFYKCTEVGQKVCNTFLFKIMVPTFLLWDQDYWRAKYDPTEFTSLLRDRRDIWAVWSSGNGQGNGQCSQHCTEEQPTEWSLVPTHWRGLSPKTGVASSNVATFYSHHWSSSATLMTFWWPRPPFVSILS